MASQVVAVAYVYTVYNGSMADSPSHNATQEKRQSHRCFRDCPEIQGCNCPKCGAASYYSRDDGRHACVDIYCKHVWGDGLDYPNCDRCRGIRKWVEKQSRVVGGIPVMVNPNMRRDEMYFIDWVALHRMHTGNR